MLLATGLGAAFLLEVLARLVDLRAKRRDALRSRLELQSELPALSAEVLELLICVVGFLFQTSRFAIERSYALFCLRHAISHGGSCRNGVQDGIASQF